GGARLGTKEEPPLAQVVEIASASPTLGGAQRRGGFGFVAGAGSKGDRGPGFKNRHAPPAERSGVDGDAVRLAGGQAREVQRNCVRRRRSHTGHWRRPDEPGGCESVGRLEGGGGVRLTCGERGVEGRVLFISGWVEW